MLVIVLEVDSEWLMYSEWIFFLVEDWNVLLVHVVEVGNFVVH